MSKNKLEKFAELKKFKNVIQPNIKGTYSVDFELKGKWNENYFENNNPITLELGCGKAEYTIFLSQKYKNQNFIAVDIKGARIWKGAKEALEKNLNNTVFLRTRIDLINAFFDKNEVNEIWIPFPDPQAKKQNKRLTSPHFLNLYKKFITKDCIIHLKTDSFPLYEYTLEMLEYNKIKPIIHSNDLYSSIINEDLTEVKTFYEKQFISQGKKITYIKFRINNIDKLIDI